MVVAVASLAGAGTLTLMRVLQPHGGPWVQLISFTPLALVAYLLVVVLMLGGALRRKSLQSKLLVAALAGVLLHAWWLAPFYTGQAPPPSPQSATVSVMTVNLLAGRADPLQVVRTVSEHSVDVLALVEVTPQALATMDAAGFAGLFPYRAGGAEEGVRGTVLLSRTPLSNPTDLATWCRSVAADVELDGSTVRVVAVHPRPPIKWAEQWWAEHAVIAKAAADADLMLGDFNATLDHKPMMMLADLGLRDAAESANDGWRPTWPMDGSLGSPVPLVQIDHVLVARKLAALGTRVVRVDGTDHAAVLADVALK